MLDQTRQVHGVETRIIVEHETLGGQLIEVSSNYFAISKKTGDVFYVGEDVDMFKDGRVSSNEGSWHAGMNGARFGGCKCRGRLCPARGIFRSLRPRWP